MHREHRRRTVARLLALRSSRRKTPALVLLIALLVLAWTGLAVTAPPRGPGPTAAPIPPLASAPTPAASFPPSVLGTVRPDGDTLSVLETISTENGSIRPGNALYSGGVYPVNVT